MRYDSLGGSGGFLGAPLTGEVRTPNGRGAYVVFQGGSIYWSPATGAQEVHGAIRNAYGWAGWEGGYLGFPRTNEVRTPDGRGAYNVFEGGSIYWSPQAGPNAHVVRGAIRDAWGQYSWEGGPFGYPTSSEFDIPGGKRSNFQRGWIEWRPSGMRMFAESGVPGCGSPHRGASPEEAVTCFMRAWEMGRGDVMANYTSNAIVTEQLKIREVNSGVGPYTVEGCGRATSGFPRTSAGIHCVVQFPAPPGEVHGGVMTLGIGLYDRGAWIEELESIG
ncbi:LGFP repeat-containing protein [Kineococcus xinjiangensis]|uniref:LGFP repeat-containing protein n=1 Tax=Kineococcus xinjiangensis TaxID=512762 RepID=A0A2S6IDI0_9ACTN|nr:LGFP repeat-containing protein [Kineococcus xinjiangensis]